MRAQGAPHHVALRCSDGLWEVAFPLVVDDEHVATVVTGQFFYDDDEVDTEVFARRAREFGFDESDYLKALARVPVFSHAQVEKTVAFLADFVGVLGELGRNALRQQRDLDALTASEQQLRGLAEDTPILICTTRADETITFVNEATAKVAGRTTMELIGRPVTEFLGAETIAYMKAARARLTPENPVDMHEESLVRHDGALRCYEWTNHGFFDEDGHLLRVQAMGWDITERKEAEQHLMESRELLDSIIRHDQNAIAVFDKELRYVYISERYLTDYRLGDRDVIGRKHDEVLPDVPERWTEVYQRALGGAVEHGEEDPFPHADGSVDWLRWECRPWYASDGSVGGIVFYSEVITERREAAARLRRSQRRYETFINATDDMAFLKDDELRYVMVNKANADFFGLAAGDVVGKTDADIMGPEEAAACRASDLRCLETAGVIVTTELQGGRLYETRKFPVDLGEGLLGVGGYVRDVTERQRAEEKVRDLAADLERRVEQRTAQLKAANDELESFAYSISHDLRAPLRALDGFSQIILQDYDAQLDATGKNYLQRIKGAANHMASLMDALLQLSRLTREEPVIQRVDVSALARDLIGELREEDPDRPVEVRIQEGLHADADPEMLRVVLTNLLSNAWKFTSRHETARIEVGRARTGDGDAAPAFYVKDDGAGFDPRYAHSLFGAFQRLHTADQFEGTGIGLATVRRIVHRHGGEVWAEGEVEKGATFWFTLEPSQDTTEGRTESRP